VDLYADHKVIAVTPAGRRRYMEVLAAHLLAQRDVIDEWHLWANTTSPADIEWMKALEASHPDFIKLVWPEGQVNQLELIKTIHQFFRGCVEEKTIYIRFDDDVVYIHDDAVRELCRYRLANPQHFIVFANTINNAMCSHIHARIGALSTPPLPGYGCLDPVGWGSGEFAVQAHKSFLEALGRGDVEKFVFSQWINWAADRVSINCFAWLGEDFAEFNGVVGEDEEEWLTVTYPRSRGLSTAICGTALVAHLAFFPQRPAVDSTGILGRYGARAPKSENPVTPH
jgi:hypothetical protein